MDYSSANTWLIIGWTSLVLSLLLILVGLRVKDEGRTLGWGFAALLPALFSLQYVYILVPLLPGATP